ncbi:MAG: ABC transporter ATP-binding protein [Archangium sp.]|nr:ABC transporter ATP-binding protein [Archangium sp.]
MCCTGAAVRQRQVCTEVNRFQGPVIQLKNISKRFGGVPALDDVSLDLNAGERVALIGENGAGKSSLMNVLYGLYQPDSGEVCFDGKRVVVKTPAEALARGVGMVHQHFTLVPTLTVTENVVLGHEPTRFGRLDLERARREVDATCAKFGFQLDTSAVVRTLSVGSQQKVEIVKALHRGVKTLILDEPTAVLTPQEADELFAVTRKLSDEGLAVVLISHKLKEVFAFSTRIAVMRRGKKVAEVKPAETTPDAVAALMIGEGSGTVTPSPSGRGVGVREQTLSLTNVSAEGLKPLTLALRGGEILGIAGVDGNGQRELAEVLTGLREFKGTLTFETKPFTSKEWTPRVARESGVTHIPEDRLKRAIISDLSVEENASLGRHRSPPFAKGARIDFAARRTHTAKLLETHDVRPREPQLRVGGLSGGNQQKLVVGRELDSSPKVVVVVQPTRGLDIAAVAAVRERLREQRDRGCAVLLVSLDLDEVLELSDRVLVMYGGALNGEFAREKFDERALGQHMLGARDA